MRGSIRVNTRDKHGSARVNSDISEDYPVFTTQTVSENDYIIFGLSNHVASMFLAADAFITFPHTFLVQRQLKFV